CQRQDRLAMRRRRRRRTLQTASDARGGQGPPQAPGHVAGQILAPLGAAGDRRGVADRLQAGRTLGRPTPCCDPARRHRVPRAGSCGRGDMDFSTINWLAVIIAAVASWALGAVWYMVLADRWLAAIGKTREELNSKDPAPYIWSVVVQLVMAVALAMLTP